MAAARAPCTSSSRLNQRCHALAWCSRCPVPALAPQASNRAREHLPPAALPRFYGPISLVDVPGKLLVSAAAHGIARAAGAFFTLKSELAAGQLLHSAPKWLKILRRGQAYMCVRMPCKHGAEINSRFWRFGAPSQPAQAAPAPDTTPCFCAGKGRGVVLTRDVEAGELLMVSKPVAVLYNDTDTVRASTHASMGLQSGEMKVPTWLAFCSLCSMKPVM